VYVRDSFGSGYQQALAAAAGPLGLHIHLDGVASDGAGGADVDDLRIVVGEVKSHRENIMIVAMFDYGPFLDVVLELDMLSSDYAYVLIEGASQATGLGTRQRQQLSGMLSWAVSGPVSSAQTAATARLSDVWSTLTPADCANEVFVPNATMFAQAPPDVAAFTFDAVAALALAISYAEYGDASGGVAQAGGTATERQRRRLAELLNVSFDGTSGLVRFDRSGDRLAAGLGFELCNFVIGLDADVSCRAARIVDGAGVRHVRDIVWLQNSRDVPKDESHFRAAANRSEAISLTVLFCSAALATALLLASAWRHLRRRRHENIFRLVSTGLPPKLALGHGQRWHLFLSESLHLVTWERSREILTANMHVIPHVHARLCKPQPAQADLSCKRTTLSIACAQVILGHLHRTRCTQSSCS
jgi:hypothetical protein